MQLHLCGLTPELGGQLYHTSRDSSRPEGQEWTRWTNVKSFHTNDPGRIVVVDCASTPADDSNDRRDLHICGITDTNRLVHTIRKSTDPPSWQGFFGDFTLLAAGLAPLTDPPRYQQIAVAEVNGDLHVCITYLAGARFRIAHAIRFTGRPGRPAGWQGFLDIHSSATLPGDFAGGMDCATAGGQLHVCAVAEREERQGLWHTIRFADDSWQVFGDVGAVHGNPPPTFADVGIAGIGEDLHVCATTQGTLVHTIRFGGGAPGWQPNFGNVEQAVGIDLPNPFTNVDCASVDGDLHVCTVAGPTILYPEYEVLRTVRYTKAEDWRRPWENVTTTVGEQGGTARVIVPRYVTAAGL